MANQVPEPTVHHLAKWCREIADANGFQAPDWETNFVHKVAYAITELDEAVDYIAGVTGAGEDPLEEELADTAIRILDLLGGIWGDSWCSRVEGRRPFSTRTSRFQPIQVLVWPIVGHLCKALEAYRHENRRQAQQRLELALLECYRVADLVGCNLTREIGLKCEKNEGRPKLHGKARSEG
jgi:NTP pyrophosphatase (non-canonical NTP hydrolase)